MPRNHVLKLIEIISLLAVRRPAVTSHSGRTGSGTLCSLNLIVAAITLWNTVYIERAVDNRRLEHAIDDALLSHLSPLGWEHVHLTGDYVWHANRRVAKGRYRALRYAEIINFRILAC